jgi:hypothetical protein
MCPEPENPSRRGRVNANLVPPTGFIGTMHLAVMSPARRNSKFIAGIAAKRRGLHKSQMMGIGRTSAADQTNEGLIDLYDRTPVGSTPCTAGVKCGDGRGWPA